MAGYPGRGLHGTIVEQIGGRIVRGDYSPGELLPAATLETEFNASKTAVREALKVLAAKGLLDSRQRRGTFVLPRTSWSLLDPDLLRWLLAGTTWNFTDDLAELRMMVEPMSARLAARRRTPADLAELTAALDAMDSASSDPDSRVDGELRFHRAILAASRNELLSRLTGVVETAVRLGGHGGSRAETRLGHRGVLLAITAADETAAAERMQALLADRGAPLAGPTVPPAHRSSPAMSVDAVTRWDNPAH